MQWTDRIRSVKIMLVTATILVAVASLLVSHWLVADLTKEERNKMEVWAEALRTLNDADEHTDLSLVLAVMEGNNTIPVIVLDHDGTVTDYRNIDVEGRTRQDSLDCLVQAGLRMKANGHAIRIETRSSHDYQLVCYDESVLLKRLSAWPYVQLGVVTLLVVVAVFALLSSKRAEQNKVWVGLSKETAHQLGTPISSMMAWMEMLKELYPEETLLQEMDHDVKRLERIAERFSKIGSVPELQSASMNDLLARVVEYMRRRVSDRVRMVCHFPEHPVTVNMNASLFEWVVENLCKNAVDAMEGAGTLTLEMTEDAHTVTVDVTDTGKGIRKKDVRHVFLPGFTTKKRGWGLGLSLARRIVEEYHHGRIFVKTTEIGKGTTFRIVLYKGKNALAMLKKEKNTGK